MRKFIVLFAISFVFSGQVQLEKLALGKRGEQYRVWIYFMDKVDSRKSDITQKALTRRKKEGIKSAHLWHDLNVSDTYKNQIMDLGINVLNESRWLNAVSALCHISDLEALANLPFVKKIEPVLGYRHHQITFKNNVFPNSRDFDYGNAQAQIEQINVHELHNEGFTGDGVRILVMDTGFNLSHIALDGINVVAQWDVINDDNETANETSEEQNSGQDYHGTAVLSTIAANSPGEFMGVAFDAEFLLAKTEDVTQEIPLEEDNYVAGLEWGEANGADVVSTSLGYLDWYTYEDMNGNTAVTTNAIDIAVGLGMVCVTAAGNEGNDGWYYIIAPADADSVIAVGAVRQNGEIASFSSHGPTYDGRIKPEVCARGSQTWCINPNNTTGYTQLSGTSLACPLVGGAVALIRQVQPDWSAMQVREAILMTASQSSDPDNSYGYGIMNAKEASEYDYTVAINETPKLPADFYVSSAYPNPFNPSVSLDVIAPKGSFVKVDVFTINGTHVSNLYSGKTFRSNQQLIWNPNMQSGIYLIRTIVNNQIHTQKITLLN